MIDVATVPQKVKPLKIEIPINHDSNMKMDHGVSNLSKGTMTSLLTLTFWLVNCCDFEFGFLNTNLYLNPNNFLYIYILNFKRWTTLRLSSKQ